MDPSLTGSAAVCGGMVHGVFGQDVGLLRALVDIDRIDQGQGAIAIPFEAAIGLIVDAADQIGRRPHHEGESAGIRRRDLRRGFIIDRGLRDLGQGFVGLLFFSQRLIDQLGRLRHVEFQSPRL